MPCVVPRRSCIATKSSNPIQRPSSPDAPARGTENQQRFEIGEAAERQPGDAGNRRAEQQHESRLDRDLERAKRRGRRTEDQVRDVKVFVHPDRRATKMKPSASRRSASFTARDRFVMFRSRCPYRQNRGALWYLLQSRLRHAPAKAGVAQLVEQLIRNQQVRGSSPRAGSSFPHDMCVRSRAVRVNSSGINSRLE